jgi:hypothetical protein
MVAVAGAPAEPAAADVPEPGADVPAGDEVVAAGVEPCPKILLIKVSNSFIYK